MGNTRIEFPSISLFLKCLFAGRLGLYRGVLGRRMPDPTGVVTQNLVPGTFTDPGQELRQDT